MKLIVCDLDGTLLLKGEKTLKKSIADKICSLQKKGALFAVASGRAYIELKRIFQTAGIDDVFFIASDGALIVRNDETIFEKSFFPCDINYFFNFENVVFHSKFISYVKSNSVLLKRKLANEYGGHTVCVLSADELISPINKITVYEQNYKKIIEAEKNYLKIYDGRELCDFAPENSNKGNAVAYLCKSIGVEKSDLYTLGDNLNDLPMLALTENSFCVKASKYIVKKASNHEILSGEAFLKYLYDVL